MKKKYFQKDAFGSNIQDEMKKEVLTVQEESCSSHASLGEQYFKSPCNGTKDLTVSTRPSMIWPPNNQDPDIT